MMILLTADEANQVRTSPLEGEEYDYHALEPRELKDGNFVLPVEVLDDPAHAQQHDFLVELPQIEDPKPEDYWEPDPGPTGA
jgi:hypothetical protein